MVMERLPRSSVNFISAVVSSIGVALLVNLLARELVENPELERLIAAVSLVVSTGLLFFWYRRLSSIAAVMEAVRFVLKVQIYVFAVVGILASLTNLFDLLRRLG
jgi:predicted neutral ceramidase superfamily lipid hydrolase